MLNILFPKIYHLWNNVGKFEPDRTQMKIFYGACVALYAA